MQNMRQALQKQDRPPTTLKRGRPTTAIPPGGVDMSGLTPAAKKIMTDKNYYTNRRLANRPDVPQDVKELVSKLKKDTSNEMRSMKKKISRLEKQVTGQSTKLAAAAEEKLKKLPPPPHVLAAAAAAKEAAAKVPPPTKPKPRPKPVGPPPTFESRFKELQDYKLANNTTRVPGRIPGLGRW